MKCVVNKHSVRKNNALRIVQKKARKYYQEKMIMKAPNATKSKIRKLADLGKADLPDEVAMDLMFQENLRLFTRKAVH